MRWPWKEVIRRTETSPVYLTRWMLFPKNTIFNVYLHKFTEPDWSADMHCHPFNSLGLVLKGWYKEKFVEDPESYVGESFRFNKPGDIRYRTARFAHAIVDLGPEPVWTIFVRFRSVKPWYFWIDGWDGPNIRRERVDSYKYIEENGGTH